MNFKALINSFTMYVIDSAVIYVHWSLYMNVMMIINNNNL
jgi:hypothetical protein